MPMSKLPVKQQSGFTLIEVMLVILLVGLMASAIQFNFGGNNPDKILQQSSARFAGIFDIAAEYSMLNNIELGIVIGKTEYQFLAYDGTNWVPLPDNSLPEALILPEGVVLSLELDDLPIEEPLLFDSSIFTPEEDSFAPEEEEKIIPQIYILSGGDITPFSLTFSFEDNFELEQDYAYRVTGIYSTILLIEGPILEN